MASFTERLKIVLDLQADKVETGLKKVSTAIKDAEGFTGKLTAGITSASQAFFGSPAALAGAATVAGGVLAKVTSEAADLGVEIGKLSDATGLSTEQASRWVEVAKDMGIGSDKLAGLLEKMEKNIGASPDKFKNLGIFIQHAADGTTDMNATMLLAVDRLNAIQDPSQRAAAEASLFGKSWADASELLKMSSSDIKKQLEDVGSSKVYSSQQVKDARAFRDQMQELKNVGEDLAIEVGKDLLPVFIGLAKGAIAAAKGIEAVVDAAAKVGQQGTETHFADIKALVDKYGDAVWKSDYAVRNHIKSLKDWIDQNGFGKLSVDEFTKSVEAQRSKTLDAVAAQAEHRQGTYDWTQAQDDAQRAAQALTDEEKAQEQATRDLQKATDDYAKSVTDLYHTERDRLALKDQITSMLDDWKKGHDKNIDSAIALSEKITELNVGTLDSKAAVENQIGVLNILEQTTKKGSPLWNAIEEEKNKLKDLEDQVIHTQGAMAGLNAQASNAAAGGAPGVFGAGVSVPPGGRGPEVAGYTVVNQYFTQKVTAKEVFDLAVEAQRRYGPIPRF